MEGRVCLPGMSPEQFEEAQRMFEVTEQAVSEERWRMCCLLASKRNHELLGKTEFELRDNERRKKGGTQAAASSAQAGETASSAITTPGSSAGGRRRS